MVKTGYLVGFRDLTGLRIGRRKRKRPTVGGRGRTGKGARVENRIFRDLCGLKDREEEEEEDYCAKEEEKLGNAPVWKTGNSETSPG